MIQRKGGGRPTGCQVCVLHHNYSQPVPLSILSPVPRQRPEAAAGVTSVVPLLTVPWKSGGKPSSASLVLPVHYRTLTLC